LAASHGGVCVAKALLKKGANVNYTDKDGNTALLLAVKNHHIELVETLLKEKDININAVDQNGYTPLYWAVKYHLHWDDENNYTELVEILLKEEGINVNVVDRNGDTLLYWATKHEQIDIINTLLQKGADPFLENNSNQTPRQLADSYDVKQLLEQAENELHRMKGEKIGNSETSFYELWKASDDSLIHYAHNTKMYGELYKELDKGQRQNNYPICAKMINAKWTIIKYLKENAIGREDTEIDAIVNRNNSELINSNLTDISLESAREGTPSWFHRVLCL